MALRRPRRRKKREHRIHRRRGPYSTDIKIILSVFGLLLVVLWVLLFIAGVPVVGLVILSITTIIILLMMWFFLSMKMVIPSV